jgi:hypothetical protein
MSSMAAIVYFLAGAAVFAAGRFTTGDVRTLRWRPAAREVRAS